MRISSRCEYGLRAMVYLAGQDTAKPIPLTEIVAEEGIPGPFLERIMARLRDSGLVKTARGAGGGYRLARGANTIAVGDVVVALDGPLTLVGCLPDESSCERAPSCASRTAWRRLDAAVSTALNGITLQDLVGERDTR